MNSTPNRIEPTFGNNATSEPQNSPIGESATDKPAAPKQPISLSLHSKQSPGHTFTPVMKRPVEQAKQFASLEEQSQLNAEKVAAQPVAQPAAAPKVESKPAPNLGFAFTPADAPKQPENAPANTTKPMTAEPIVAHKPTTEQPKVEQPKMEQPKNDSTNTLERIIPAAASTQTDSTKGSVIGKVPSKFRRLLLVALLALALLLVFFLLKPKAPETVEALQEQGSSLPIEFRPVDEAEAKRAEEEAKALLQQQEAQAQQAVQVAQENANVAANSENSTATSSVPAVANNAVSSENSVAQTTETTTAAQPVAAPVVNKPLVIEPVKKPTTNGSVIYQPENSKPEPTKVVKVAPVKSEPTKVEPAKAEPTKAVAPTVAKKEPAPAATKPAQPAPAVKVPAAETASNGAVGSKTLTVQKGVSLFQNFRDNGLEANLPELNKMTKLNGETSRLSPGQKITVRLDANKRIVEMNIGSGKYVRQADGSYIYK